MADKKLTVKEFQYWLEGVEAMMDDDWLPNATQWKRIREKIRLLEAEVPPPPVIYREMAPGMMAATQPAPIAPNADGTVVVPAGAGGLGSMNIDPRSFPPPTMPAGAPGAPNNPVFGNPDDKTKAARTPTIDTSGGKKFQSTFT